MTGLLLARDQTYSVIQGASPRGFEPLTDRVETGCSIPLSYGDKEGELHLAPRSYPRCFLVSYWVRVHLI